MDDKTQLIINFINENSSNMPHVLREKLIKNGEKLNYRFEFDEIRKSIDDFIGGEELNRFIVLPGIRGVGKTTLLYQAYYYLLNDKHILPEQIIYLSCDDLNNLVDCNIRKIVEIYLKNQFNTNLRLLDREIFLLIDESQYDKNWSMSGKIIYDRSEKIFMIFTGSSALNLEYNADAARRMFKRVITPLNYNEHVKLKYNYSNVNLGNSLVDLILNGNPEDAIKYENEVNRALINNIEYTSNDWDEYLRYGGFPILARKIDFRKLSANIVDMVEKVVNTDMVAIKNFTFENQTNSNRILRYLALQNAGDLSQNNLAKYLKTSQANVKNILDILEKTHLIFSLEAYGTSSKRIKKTKKYYFATSSIRNALSIKSGNTIKNIKQYEGILLENLVASILFNLTQRENNYFKLYYDANKKKNVDFILQQDFKNPVPIEVGRGKKDKKQITHAINNYGADYGIIISDTTSNIEKQDNIIYIPPKTFSFL
ncbi:ATP-binding protein [Methanobrevibacter sp.]|uniref:ATP-binding protein n=1 Tax=Methanobrevibacter sp. TaxID=66852 RepID=UPI00388E054C